MKTGTISFLRLPAAVLIVGGSTAPLLASGDTSFTVVPKIAYSYKTVSFDAGSKGFKPLYQSLDLGITGAIGGFYASGSYDSSVKDSTIHDTTLNGSGKVEDSILQFSRTDWAVTLGYGIGKGFSVFGGYRSGKTDIIGFSHYEYTAGDPVNGTFVFELKGPFLGVGQSFRFSKGSLDLSAAYAIFVGELTSDRYNTTEHIVRSGDASGYSVAISWSGPLAENAGYAVGLKTNRYRFDADVAPGDDDLSFKEIHNIFYVSASKYF